MPSSKTALTAPLSIAARRLGSLGCGASWSLPPQRRTCANEKPAALSTAATVNIVALLASSFRGIRPVESRNGIFSRAICARPVMPVDSCTAKPITSQDGNTATARSGKRLRKGPLPRHAIVRSTDGLTHAMEYLPSATAMISRKLPVAKEIAISFFPSLGRVPSDNLTTRPTRVSVCSTPSAARSVW